MALKFFGRFHALRELLVQSEANSYSTAIANHDFMLRLTCCMKLTCIVGHQKQAFVPLPGSALLFRWFCICLLHWNRGELGLD